MGGCSSKSQVLKQQQATSREIERNLKHDRHRMKREVKILLLGPGESGKSTILKQMRLIHARGFSPHERLAYRSIVFSNVLEGMISVLEAAERFNIPLASEENKRLAGIILAEGSNIEQMVARDFIPAKCRYALTELWKDEGVRRAFLRGNEYALHDNFGSFMEDLERISNEKYVPTDMDILKCRSKTTGIVEVEFHIDPLVYKMVDVGGQRSERKKWIHCFENVTAVLFVVGLSGYDSALHEDRDSNQMHESLLLFDQIVNSPYFVSSSIILFFNKMDLFSHKVQYSPIKTHFPDYCGPERDEVKGAAYFKRRFLRLSRDLNKQTYLHTTTATDTKLLKKVMQVVATTILQENLKDLM
ncbi:uncharacterized protein VTP21DRAFT_11135 [Calcarisporiella thermophila]|uniref:uncharacterized protein n=1 Tax=Calcarisporiella thermophila TaxID=911321 RepID=UPI0037442CDB